MTNDQKCKRAVDVIISSLVFLLLTPALLFTALALLIMEGRPIFYTSRRHVTKDKWVIVRKFRTMVRNATSDQYRLHERFMRGGYLDIPLSCEVFTPIGRWIERTQLVEVPQLATVLEGRMSLIGNRPLPAHNVELLKSNPGWEKRFDSPAGISGISQVVGKLNLTPAERLELESAYSLVYQSGNILKCDLMILFYTLRVVAFGKSIPLAKARALLQSAMAMPNNATADLISRSYDQSAGE